MEGDSLQTIPNSTQVDTFQVNLHKFESDENQPKACISKSKKEIVLQCEYSSAVKLNM